MRVTARSVAIVCGVLLGGFGVLGLLVTPGRPSETNFLLASWLLPVTLFPAAALAVALDPDISREIGGQAATVWPAHLGLALYGFVTGPRWLAAASSAAHGSYAAIFMIVVMALHAAVFLIGGAAFALFPKTRPAGFQIWLAYPVLLGSWGLGCLLL
jgi:hypothetical protein